MALQLTGAYKELGAREPAGAACRRRDRRRPHRDRHRHRAARVLPGADREGGGRACTSSPNEKGAEAVRAMFDRGGVGAAPGAARATPRARGRARASPPRKVAIRGCSHCSTSGGGVSLAYRRSVLESPAYRLNHEEVQKSLEEGVRYIEGLSPTEAVLDERGHVKAHRRSYARACDAWRTRRGGAPGAHGVRRGRYEPQHDVREGVRRHLRSSMRRSSTSRLTRPRRREDGKVVFVVGDAQPTRPSSRATRRTARGRVLLRRQPPALRGQRREGDGERQARLRARRESFSRASLTSSPAEQPERNAALVVVLRQAATTRSARRWSRSIVSPSRSSRSSCRRPRRRASSSPVSSIGSRTSSRIRPWSRGTRLGDGGPRAHGRVDRRREGTPRHDRARDGRIFPPLRRAPPRRTHRPHGADRYADRDQAGRNRAARRRWPRQRRSLLDCACAQGARGDRCSTSRATRKARTFSSRTRSSASPTRSSGAPIRVPRSSRAAARTCKFRGNIVQAMVAYGKGVIGASEIKLSKVNRIIAIGSDRMMAAVKEARHGVLQPMLDPRHLAIGSINSPMQCMMKEVCAQCLQKHTRSQDGQRDARLLLLQPGPGARRRRLPAPQRAPPGELDAGEGRERVARAPARHAPRRAPYLIAVDWQSAATRCDEIPSPSSSW